VINFAKSLPDTDGKAGQAAGKKHGAD